MISVAQNIRELREAKGLSQSEVAQVVNLSRPTYNAIEIGKRQPTLNEISSIAAILNTTLEELLFNSQQASSNEAQLGKFKQIILNCLQYGSDEHDHKITKTKLAKLVYLSDFAYYYRNLKSMSGLSYRSIQQGPVADAYFRVIDELFEGGSITIDQRGTAMMISANESAPTSELSQDEIDVIKEVCVKWQGKSTQEIVTFTHEQTPWKTTAYGQVIPYELITLESAENVI
jgi:transcriptional regulator with XRE-family HTH domain